MNNSNLSPETFSREETIIIATTNQQAIDAVKSMAIPNKKKLYYAEPGSPDILAIPCFCIVGDTEFIGQQTLQTFQETFSVFTSASDKIFLVLVDNMPPEIVTNKVREAILKMEGIFMYVHEKKHRISIRKYDRSGYRESPAGIDDLEELIELMKLKNVYSATLGFNTMMDDSANVHLFGIKPAEFTNVHFEWLITTGYGSYRYLEIN